jgi:hypothetical protein
MALMESNPSPTINSEFAVLISLQGLVQPFTAATQVQKVPTALLREPPSNECTDDPEYREPETNFRDNQSPRRAALACQSEKCGLKSAVETHSHLTPGASASTPQSRSLILKFCLKMRNH